MTPRRFVVCTCVAIAAIALASPARAQVPSRDSLRILLKRATYVFRGVVEQWNAVADPALALNPRHAVVNVTKVFSCPTAVGDFTNERITIRYPNPSVAPAGTNAWFLGSGWTIGDHIATSVLMIVPIRSEQTTEAFLSRLNSAVHLSKRSAVRAESQAADMTALVTVQNVGSSYLPFGTPRTEHAEYWSIVRIRVDSVRGRNGQGAGTWLSPADSMRNITILAPPEAGYDTAAAGHLSRGATRLLFLNRITRRPSLRSIDSSAVAFLPTAVAIHPISDASLLGNALSNPFFGVDPIHPCGQPIR